jgi:hypothetical protein
LRVTTIGITRAWAVLVTAGRTSNVAAVTLSVELAAWQVAVRSREPVLTRKMDFNVGGMQVVIQRPNRRGASSGWRRRSLALAVALVPVVFALGPVGLAAAESPATSFVWFPSAPVTGETISLVSTSTDASSPITGFAWDLAGDGAFAEAGPVVSTMFSAPGNHVVQLRVTDGNGASSVATEQIEVTSPPAIIMEPFPIVRFVASDTESGAKLILLSVEAPQGAEVTVACRGRGCPVRSESTVAGSTGVGTATVKFRRFERALRAGLVLELRVWKHGEIGAYTRLVIRHRRPPARYDACLDPAGIVPIACPA